MAWHSKLVTLISFTEAKRCREKLLCCIRRYVKHYMGYQIWSKYAVTSSFEYFPLIFNCSPNRDKTEIQNDVSSLHCYAIALVWNESENSVTAKTTGWRLALHFCFVPFFIFYFYTLYPKRLVFFITLRNEIAKSTLKNVGNIEQDLNLWPSDAVAIL